MMSSELVSASVAPDDALWCDVCYAPCVEEVYVSEDNLARGAKVDNIYLGLRCSACGWEDLECPRCGSLVEQDNKELAYSCVDALSCGWDEHWDVSPEPNPAPEPEPVLDPPKLEPPSRYPPRPKHWMSNSKYQGWRAGYLQSDTWRDLRSRVLFRTRGTCEGCLERPATDVHHMSYAHEGEEFCFELRALCRKCHARWHGKPE